mgnify:CR=1 FL=1
MNNQAVNYDSPVFNQSLMSVDEALEFRCFNPLETFELLLLLLSDVVATSVVSSANSSSRSGKLNLQGAAQRQGFFGVASRSPVARRTPRHGRPDTDCRETSRSPRSRRRLFDQGRGSPRYDSPRVASRRSHRFDSSCPSCD